MDASARLEEHLAQPTEIPNENPQFRIDNKEMAIWALRKLANIERNRNEARAAAQAEIERIQTWLADEEKKADQERGFFEFHLEHYHRRVLAENPKTKTIKLPHGELQLRTQQPDYEKNDNVLLFWALKNLPHLITFPHWIRPDPKLDWAELKKALEIKEIPVVDQETGEVIDRKFVVINPPTGEIIPGITVTRRPEKFNIKLEL